MAYVSKEEKVYASSQEEYTHQRFLLALFKKKKTASQTTFSDSNNSLLIVLYRSIAHEFHACARFITKQLRHGSIVYYRIYPYLFPVLVLKIEHSAFGLVLYFKYLDRKRVRIHPIMHSEPCFNYYM